MDEHIQLDSDAASLGDAPAIGEQRVLRLRVPRAAPLLLPASPQTARTHQQPTF
jgi:hypothetical protein